MQDETSFGNLSHRAPWMVAMRAILTEDGLRTEGMPGTRRTVLSRLPKPWACTAPVTKEVQTPETERKPFTSSHLEAGDTPRAP